MVDECMLKALDIQVEMLVKGKWNPGSLTNVWYEPESRDKISSPLVLLSIRDSLNLQILNKEHNGVIEGENRIIVEAARSMLHAKHLPEKLWAEAVNTIAYDLNITGPTPVAGKSPYEIWFKRQPSVDLQNFLALNTLFKSQSRKEGSLVPDKNDFVLSRDVVSKDEIMSEETTIEIFQTESTEEVCEEDASCIDAREETDIKNIVDLNTSLKTKVYNLRNRLQMQKSSRFDAFVMLAERKEPFTFQEAINSPSRKEWRCYAEELNSLKGN
ncbi:hypothetical protein AVEN_244343-1 [Araneus ventricosus]|uniref:Retrovirus-related Pol polyprotein from transposon TNT 1-94 n=1 Tax=Araneus ventricosus TaxID=182803 RepID=A0A4Y2LHR7_ARAVE|nr:hypothetical protein AVEN_244343-1 [Araneus ventricosus]